MSPDTHLIGRVESEARVIRRAQHGDANAFATLFYTHKPRIYSLCLRMTNNIAEAEDLNDGPAGQHDDLCE